MIEQTTGDVAFPGAGYYAAEQNHTFWFLTPCRNELGNFGYTLVENAAEQELLFAVSSPVYRQTQQVMCRQVQAFDKPAELHAGDKITFDLRFSVKEANSVSCLFRHMAEVRNMVEKPGTMPAIFPLYQADRLIKEKYCRSNWDAASGYFMSATDINSQSPCSHWQLGWVGGSINTLPMLFDEDEKIRSLARQDMTTLFDHAQSESGLFYGVAMHGKYYNDSFAKIIPDNKVLLRKNADVLFFLLKHFLLMERNGEAVPEKWKQSVSRLASAFTGIWKKYHQFGQWVNVDTAEIVTGGSASAVMAIGGLALASQYYSNSEFLETAQEAADYYVQKYLEKGILNGCPGEIMQACDSEAAAAMLESMVTLWEITKDSKYLDFAEKAALYTMSWCVSYDYQFPPESPFAQLDMKSCGTVWANVQNKHSAPGFCTASGVALLRLYRATGKRLYLNLIRDVAHALPQFVSRPDRKIVNLEDGWVNERVNLSDWEGAGMVGNVFYGSCWPEISLMLSFLELPGVYVRKDTREIWCMDHVEAHWEDDAVVICNPTGYTAKVQYLAEDESDLENTWSVMEQQMKYFVIPAGGCVKVDL